MSVSVEVWTNPHTGNTRIVGQGGTRAQRAALMRRTAHECGLRRLYVALSEPSGWTIAVYRAASEPWGGGEGDE